MAATKEKHFSECLHLINEARSRPLFDSHHALSPTSPPPSSWSTSEMRNTSVSVCFLCRAVMLRRFWRKATIIKLPMFLADNIQIKEWNFFHYHRTSLMKENAIFFFSCSYFIQHVVGTWHLSQMCLRTLPGTSHGPVRHTCPRSSDSKVQGGDAASEISIRTQGTVAAPVHGTMLTCRVVRNKRYLFDFLIKSKT